jgi:tetratricopeptide (TPR) repeat protein
LQQARSLLRQGRFREGEGLYREILHVLPSNLEAIHNIGLVRLRVGDYAAAIRVFRRALQIQPNSITAYNSLGAAFHAINRHEDAIESYRRVSPMPTTIWVWHLELSAGSKRRVRPLNVRSR